MPLTYEEWVEDWLNAPQIFKQELKGKIVDEEGICLDEVPVCVSCGLEMANRTEHETWHRIQNGHLHDLQAKVDALEGMIKNLLGNVQATSDHQHKYITDEEIRKYGSKYPLY